MRSLIFSLLFATACLTASTAGATDYAFRLHNSTDGYIINGFYTYQYGRWSDNWLSRRIHPGEFADMDWNSEEGDCVVPFRVSWVDWAAEDYTIDWCENDIYNIYMENQGFTWD